MRSLYPYWLSQPASGEAGSDGAELSNVITGAMFGTSVILGLSCSTGSCLCDSYVAFSDSNNEAGDVSSRCPFSFSYFSIREPSAFRY